VVLTKGLSGLRKGGGALDRERNVFPFLMAQGVDCWGKERGGGEKRGKNGLFQKKKGKGKGHQGKQGGGGLRGKNAGFGREIVVGPRARGRCLRAGRGKERIQSSVLSEKKREAEAFGCQEVAALAQKKGKRRKKAASGGAPSTGLLVEGSIREDAHRQGRKAPAEEVME